MLKDCAKESNFTINGKLNRLKPPTTIKPEGEPNERNPEEETSRNIRKTAG
jgi:hypothetical protein